MYLTLLLANEFNDVLSRLQNYEVNTQECTNAIEIGYKIYQHRKTFL